MAPRSVAECAKRWNAFQVAKIIGRATEMIQLTPTNNEPDEGVTDTTESENGSKTFQAAVHNKSLVLELDSECCYLLIGWLYTGQRTTSKLRWDLLFNLYVFADKTDMLALRRHIMTVIRTWRTHSQPPLFEDATIALESLPPFSPSYRWLLDLYTHHWMPDYRAPEDVLPNGFLMAWIKRAAARTCVVKREACADCPCCEAALCDFHEHESIGEWKLTCGNKTSHKTSPKTDEKN
ncbi:unnamed protein product [Aureobasidium uvarum]|uniref:BTB domain-containing protein n=1 Tax=Aureobasidium uvarum TaxID=2773716 RepID=A0A9N8KR46_9PEZI|nr:unnamed protein product [Aureobasidium uvarum]